MSPLRRHGGGRPRSADSILDVAERWVYRKKLRAVWGRESLVTKRWPSWCTTANAMRLRSGVKSQPREDKRAA